MAPKRKSPLARTGAKRALNKDQQNDYSQSPGTSPPPHQIAADIKKLLVAVGSRGYISKRLCTELINILGLRGE